MPSEPHTANPSDSAPAPPLFDKPVALPTLIAYAAPLAPAYFLSMMVTVVFMNFATDVLLVAPGVIGTIFFVSKMWDAVSDPLVGTLSDRTRSRFGRRRSWIYASIVPIVLSTLMLWSPPSTLGETALMAWVAVSVLAFYTAYTVYFVPQMALGIELSPSPNERARVFAGRQIGVTLGMLGAFIIATPMILDNPAARENAQMISVIGVSFLALMIFFCTRALPAEISSQTASNTSPPLAAMRDVLRNKHARLLLFVYFIEIFGIGATSAMTPYLLIYVTKASDYVGIVFLFYTLPALLSIPFWVWMGQRYERHKVWRYAMVLQAFGYGLIIFQDEGRIGLMIFASLVNGFATACGQTLGYAIKGDVIDFDEYETGERKEGAYLAAWSLAQKFGTGLMIALSGWALQWSGFVPNGEQSALTLWTIKGMTAGAPFICILIGTLAFTRFSLDSREHARIRAAIDARASEPPATYSTSAP